MKNKINFTNINSIDSITSKKTIKGLVGHPVNAETLLLYNSKSIVYSFNNLNNLQPLFTKTEYILKSFFLSMNSLISRPVYLIKHDKIIIRLFAYLSPKADKILDTSILVKEGKLVGIKPSVLLNNEQNGKNNLYNLIKKLLSLKKHRPNNIDILNSQIQIHSLTDIYSLGINYNRLIQKLKKGIYNYNLKKRGFKALTLATHLNPININEAGAIKIASETSLYLYEDYPYTSFASTFKYKLEKLSIILKKIFKKEVEFEIIKAQVPFQDSNILAQILGYNANNYKFRRMLKILIPRAVIKNPSKELSYLPSNRPHKQALIDPLSARRSKEIATYLNLKLKDLNPLFSQPSSYLPPLFFNKYKKLNESFLLEQNNKKIKNLMCLRSEATESLITHTLNSQEKLKLSYLSGINIKLAGRLMTQSIRPRFTVQNKQEGSLARVKVHLTEKSRFTGKNKRGAYSFTVSLGHVFNNW